jgi:hypothetical protein
MSTPRRTFFKQAAAASAALALAPRLTAETADTPPGRDFHELRCYRLKAESRLKADADPAPLDAYLEQALLPALDRLGLRDVGVFTELDVDKAAASSTPKAGSPVWVLITHRTLDSFVRASAELLADPAVQAAGAGYLQAPAQQPTFERIDCWLYRAFRGLPRLEVPAFSRSRAPGRVFEMRDYESHSEMKAQNKMEMFDDGEIALMKDLGMHPVFFGQGIAGPDLPHLRYITCGPDLASHLAAWKKFGPDPRWTAMKNDPRYAGNVSRNTPRFLAPKPYSAI